MLSDLVIHIVVAVGDFYTDDLTLIGCIDLGGDML